jgi:hypothetical protein
VTPLQIFTIALRGSALALELQGQEKASGSLYLLADGIDAGRNVDAHMAEVPVGGLRQNPPTDREYRNLDGLARLLGLTARRRRHGVH